MEIKHYVKIDVSKKNVRPTIPISKGDINTHKIIFSFCNGSEPVDISKSVTAGVVVKNHTGDIAEAVIEPVGNTVEYTPNAIALGEVGNVLCVLTIADVQGKTLSAVFHLYVDEDFSQNTENEIAETLKGSEAWGIVAKVIEYAGVAYTVAQNEAKREEAEQQREKKFEEMEKMVGDIDSALDELHKYTETIIGDT